jgi:PAS domain S-box-containing protein
MSRAIPAASPRSRPVRSRPRRSRRGSPPAAWGSLIEGAPYGVFRSTPSRRRFIDVNPALAAMLGYSSKAELLRADLARDIYVRSGDRSAVIAAIMGRAETSFQTEVSWRRKDGLVLDVVLHGRRLSRPRRGGPLFEVMAEDVTARRRAERETAVALKLQSDFVSFVSHQLRTPLTGIRWMLELAQQAPGLPEETAQCLADARQSADRLVGLIADMLNVARCESGKTRWVPEEVDLAELTVSVMHELRPQVEQREHQMSFRPEAQIPRVQADANLLRQVMLNLCSNAIKYTPVGGEITMTAGRHGEEIWWSVRDNGMGVPPEARSRLFEKFFRADNAHTVETEGTGLGLYWVRRILAQGGGRVWWQPAPAKGGAPASPGSIFTFALPLQPTLAQGGAR